MLKDTERVNILNCPFSIFNCQLFVFSFSLCTFSFGPVNVNLENQENMANFVHLHTHSDYSTLDGAQKIKTIVKKAKEMGLPAVALTDHGNMFGAIELANAAKRANIKPIFGCEVYISRGSHLDRINIKDEEGKYFHLVLLAMNETGYKNLMKLSSIGYLDGFYYKPRVDKELLRTYSEGLIACSACIKGEAAVAARVKGFDESRKIALEYRDIFDGRFYLELQRHGLPQEDIVNDIFIKISKETDIPLVCTNDAHYAKQEHFEAHDALLCIGTASNISDEHRMRYANDQFYYKSPEEMAELFKDVPEALENTVKIAEQCDFFPELDKYHLPTFPIPQEAKTQDPDIYLDILVKKGLEKRFKENVTQEHIERADFEISVIKKMGFSGYFLITQDFVQWAKDNDIPVGPGRGSAAGSLVAYALGITNINPLEFDLLFERFLNPDRITMPDIDIDFCYERRGEVIDYIKDRYGEDSVTQIITFGRMKAKAVVRDIARVMGMDYASGDRFAKAIPVEAKNLEEAEKLNKDLRALIQESSANKKLWEMSKVLEGMNRQVGIHAAGVVIAPDDLLNYIPLFKSTKGDITTQYDMGCLEQVGMLKVDFLGLRTLTVIKHTLDLLKERGIEVDIDNIPMDDPRVFSLFSDARTFGLFQFESGGMREYLKKLRPTQIEDLVAMNALYRPGPMENIPVYIKRKHGEVVTYVHPLMEEILKSTYGIIVYQEQVMKIASRVAGLSLAKADTLRRAMGKKKQDVMEKMRAEFIEGAKNNEVDENVANDIYDLLMKFANYGFNKSHSVAYAYIAYQTGYLKAHYPAEFMAANLTSERGEIKRVVELVNEAKKLDIEVLPPDVNTSTAYFSVLDKEITYGLSALKSIGEKAAIEISKARNEGEAFVSIFDFASRVDQRAVNRKTFEALIYAGAMDSLEGNRSQKFKAIDLALKYGQRYQDEKLAAQVSLFGASNGQIVINEPDLEDLPDWDKQLKLEKEKEFIGFYLTGHPLEPFRDELEAVSNENLISEEGAILPETLRVGGMITNFAIAYDKKNNQYARFQFESLTHEFTVLAFKSFEKFRDLLKEDSKLYIEGTLKVDNDRDQQATVFLNHAMPLSELRETKIRMVEVRLKKDENFDSNLNKLKSIIQKYPGNKVLIIHLAFLEEDKKDEKIKVGYGINGAREMIQQLRKFLGQTNVWLK
jgi:DNA polymerase III subunit alpha